MSRVPYLYTDLSTLTFILPIFHLDKITSIANDETTMFDVFLSHEVERSV